MPVTKTTHGGKRKKAGRKPVEDRAITISIYPKKSVVEAAGGFEKAREIALEAITKVAVKNILKKS